MLLLFNYTISVQYQTNEQMYSGSQFVDSNVIAVKITQCKIVFVESSDTRWSDINDGFPYMPLSNKCLEVFC